MDAVLALKNNITASRVGAPHLAAASPGAPRGCPGRVPGGHVLWEER